MLNKRCARRRIRMVIVWALSAAIVVSGCAGGGDVREVSCRMLASLNQTLKGLDPSLELDGGTDSRVYRPDVPYLSEPDFVRWSGNPGDPFVVKSVGMPVLVRSPLGDGFGSFYVEQSLWVGFDVDVPVETWISEHRSYFEKPSDSVKWEEFKENPDPYGPDRPFGWFTNELLVSVWPVTSESGGTAVVLQVGDLRSVFTTQDPPVAPDDESVTLDVLVQSCGGKPVDSAK